MKTILFARNRIVVVAFQYQIHRYKNKYKVHEMLRCPVLNTVVGETNNSGQGNGYSSHDPSKTGHEKVIQVQL